MIIMHAYMVLYVFMLIFNVGFSSSLTEVDSPKSAIYYEKKGYGLIWLEAGNHFISTGTNFEIICQKNTTKSVINIWRSVYVLFEDVPETYKLYSGENETDVYEKYNSETIWYPISWIRWQDTSVAFPAFNQYCIGVKSHGQFIVRLDVRSVSYWKVLQTILGVLLFMSASSLSRNVIFHYTSGMSLGVIASVLVLLFVLTRFIPNKRVFYVTLAFGYSVALYYLQQFYNNFQVIIMSKKEILLAYVCFSALISFIICYRFGPVKDVKTMHIIQWAMQGVGLLMIFFSSEYREVSTVLILILLTYYFIPITWTGRFKATLFYYFPPKMKLLTETEYIEQGNVETKKALEDLRRFCNSPDCDAWKTISRLKSPQRFASFIQGSSHLSDDEMMMYDSEAVNVADVSITDDEDSAHINNHTSF